ncbi:DUF1842 domain-containing protein [Polaribacter sp. WD7]|uniref:DUF1842 domain-containing protein n=1 Tax=Polaribacter sp. WD7 TaxID=2269061 RepID=UPI000DF27EBF|nr:DUF1842 domain-containing protein [Polaribacter sp. WD7]RCS26390.1 DUF1842 domain-containing protein [Polaribacter sp. WD7]
MSKSEVIAGAYLTKGTIGNVGTPGAPIAHFSLVVVPASKSVSGVVQITQAIEGPESNIVVKNVVGQIRATGFGKVTKVVSLEGEYIVSVPPPAIGTYLSKFSAHLAIDNQWNGKGGFSYGNNDVEDVPVTSNN